MDLARLTARLLIGGLFVGHGTQKLFGWFGGGGVGGTEQMMNAIGMRPARANAVAAGVTETVGGALFAAGAATPLAAASLTGTMITAVRKVHLSNGPWVTNGGWEYNAVLVAAMLAITESGPGQTSVDAALGRERTGPMVALGALALGAVASTVAVAMGSRGGTEAANLPSTPEETAVAVAAAEGTAGDPTMVEPEAQLARS